MVGSRDYFREDIDGKENNLLALNSPGSSFKPFVYLTTFLNLNWGPARRFRTRPASYRESDGTYFSPENPNHNYNGTITRAQLARQLAQRTGIQGCARRLASARWSTRSAVPA